MKEANLLDVRAKAIALRKAQKDYIAAGGDLLWSRVIDAIQALDESLKEYPNE